MRHAAPRSRPRPPFRNPPHHQENRYASSQEQMVLHRENSDLLRHDLASSVLVTARLIRCQRVGAPLLGKATFAGTDSATSAPAPEVLQIRTSQINLDIGRGL